MKISELPKYELQPEEILRIEEIINKYKGKKGALIPTLHDVQNEVGFLPIEVRKMFKRFEYS